jgi:hypothetical protein
VYYAKKQHDTVNDKESCPARNAKLYFCGTPAGLRRDSILALFSAFGRVRHLQVYTDSYGVLSSGTVTMYSTDEAIAAMNSLDGKVLQAGTAPLKVGGRQWLVWQCVTCRCMSGTIMRQCARFEFDHAPLVSSQSCILASVCVPLRVFLHILNTCSAVCCHSLSCR